MPRIKTITVELIGISDLLQHRFTESAEEGTKGGSSPLTTTHTPEQDRRVVAEGNAYKDKAGKYYHPSDSISRMLREAGGYYKQKASRKTVKWIVPAAVIMQDDVIYICTKDGKPAKVFEVDSRPIVNKNTKGRVMCHRPRWHDWMMRFSIEVDEEILDGKTILELFNTGGRRIGLGAFRPECGGPYGRFQVSRWEDNGK